MVLCLKTYLLTMYKNLHIYNIYIYIRISTKCHVHAYHGYTVLFMTVIVLHYFNLNVVLYLPLDCIQTGKKGRIYSI